MALDVITRAAMRPLPRTVAPTRQETLDSYVARLADLNRLDTAALRAYAAGDRHPGAPVDLDTLAHLSGQPETTLTAALPELHGRPFTRPVVIGSACPRCTSRWTAPAIRRYRHLEEAVCLRHRYWLADQTNYTPGPLRLRHTLEILAAARRHRKLLRHHGPRRVDTAYQAATAICREWRDRGEHTETLDRQLDLFEDHHPREALDDLAADAGLYPQVIALTRLLASPYWSALPGTGPAGLHRFLTEVRATVTPSYAWRPYGPYRYVEPLADHLLSQAATHPQSPLP